MRAGWPTKAIGDVCSIRPPKSEARTALSPADLVSFVPMEDLPIGSKTLRLTHERPLSDVVGGYTYFADEDVLLAKITPCFENGKLGIARGLTNGIGFGSSEFVVLRPDSTLSNEWLYYSLARESFRREAASRMCGAVGHKRVPQEFIESYLIPVPPLPEQKRIIAVLDQTFEAADKGSANAEKNQLNAGRVLQTHLAEVFSPQHKGWVHSTIGSQFRFIDYRGKTPHKTKDGLRLITAKNVKMGYVQAEPREFVAPSTYKTWMTRGIPQQGDILFTTEAPLGNVAQLDTAEKVVFAQRIIILQPEHLDRRFCRFLLMSPPIQRLIHAKGTGATVKGIKASLLRTVDLWFPQSLSDQKALVSRLELIEESAARLQQTNSAKTRAFDQLRQSMLSEAFSGRL